MTSLLVLREIMPADIDQFNTVYVLHCSRINIVNEFYNITNLREFYTPSTVNNHIINLINLLHFSSIGSGLDDSKIIMMMHTLLTMPQIKTFYVGLFQMNDPRYYDTISKILDKYLGLKIGRESCGFSYFKYLRC